MQLDHIVLRGETPSLKKGQSVFVFYCLVTQTDHEGADVGGHKIHMTSFPEQVSCSDSTLQPEQDRAGKVGQPASTRQWMQMLHCRTQTSLSGSVSHVLLFTVLFNNQISGNLWETMHQEHFSHSVCALTPQQVNTGYYIINAQITAEEVAALTTSTLLVYLKSFLPLLSAEDATYCPDAL